MVKKFIISLISLSIFVAHVPQACATKQAPAIQEFFEAGNHDDTKLHMLGYLLNHRNLTKLLEEKGKFSDVLKTFVNLQDKTFKEGLEKLKSSLDENGRLNIDVRAIKIQCAQDAIKSGNKKMLERFLPEIFAENPKEHMLFPEDLTSDEAKEMLRETGILDLARRYHHTDDLERIIVSKFFPGQNWFHLVALNQLDFYTPGYIANGHRTDMRFAIDNRDKEKIQELLDGEESINTKFNVYGEIMDAMKTDDSQALCSYLEDIFPGEKIGFDLALLKQLFVRKITDFLSAIRQILLSTGQLGREVLEQTYYLIEFLVRNIIYVLTHPRETISAVIEIAVTMFEIIQCLVTTTFKLIKATPKIFCKTTKALFKAIKFIPTLMKGCAELFVCMLKGSYELAKYVVTHPKETVECCLIITALIFSAIMALLPISLVGIITGLIKCLEISYSLVKKAGYACIVKPLRYGLSLVRNPWQKIKNTFNVIINPKPYISLQLTRFLQWAN